MPFANIKGAATSPVENSKGKKSCTEAAPDGGYGVRMRF
jgi:hypothetical protein